MVDGIVLATDTGSCHKLQCKVISEADSIVEHLLVQDKPVLGNLASGRDVSQDEAPFSDARSMILACDSLTSLLILLV